MAEIRVLQSYIRQTDAQLLASAGAALKGLPGILMFTDLSVDLKALETGANELTAAIAALPHGGAGATAVRDNKRAVLIALMQKLAHYVQDNCGNDPAVVLNAGFTVRSVSRAVTALVTPSNVTIDFGKTTELVVKVNRVPKAKTYEVRVAAIGAGGVVGPWQSAGLFTAARKMIVAGLTPMTTYSIQVRAVGAAGPTDWSDPVSHICL
jgi:hypothetical protein